MLRNGILHPELAKVLASLGHGDLLIVSDAGFPVPKDAWRVDLAITRDLPDLVPVLEVVDQAVISEAVMYAEQVPSNNPVLHRHLTRIFDDVEHRQVPHEDILGTYAHQAKAVVRTGGFDPWGNIVLVAGTDPFAWFERAETVVPPFYVQRQKDVSNARPRN